MNPKPKPEGLPDQPVDPTAVVYSEVKKEKLVPKSEGSEQPPQTKTGLISYIVCACVYFMQ